MDAGTFPIDGVTVTLSLTAGAALAGDAGLPVHVTTGPGGAFSFLDLPLGSYTLTFSKVGFIAKSVTLGNSTSGPTNLVVTLAADTTPGVDAPTFQLTVTDGAGQQLDQYAVGFGTAVTVNVVNLAPSGEPLDAGGLTYQWSVTTAKTTAVGDGGVSVTSGRYGFDAGGNASSSSATFTTMTVQQAKGVESDDRGAPGGFWARAGVMAVNPDETGRYSVSVKITDQEGHNASATVQVQSTWQAPGIANVPVGVPVYLAGDSYAQPNFLNSSSFIWPNTSWSWSVVSCTDATNQNGLAAGHAITACRSDAGAPFLANANSQFPSFVPPIAGQYVFQVTETAATADAGTTGLGLDAGPGPGGIYGTQTRTVTVYAGSWQGFMNGQGTGNCGECHVTAGAAYSATPPPDNSPVNLAIIPLWQNTRHATALERKLDGVATNHFAESCLVCHTTGYTQIGDPATAPSKGMAQSVRNNGFYYNILNEAGPNGQLWQFPATLQPGNYTQMVSGWPTLGALGGIQCENCHGPGGGAGAFHNANGPAIDNQGLWTARVGWKADLCASCHEENGTHYLPGLWATSPHGSVSQAISRSAVEAFEARAQGAADPASGVESCARCHSAQGFARFVGQLRSGVTGRYDFLTTDGQRLNDGGTNAPDAAYLSAMGLSAASVEPITCQACHDPHSNGGYNLYSADGGIDASGPVDCTSQANVGLPQCMQLRIYDSLPGLPNGQGPFTGVGEGALCMACHNSHAGEHSDTSNSSPYFETASMSSATDAVFGFDTYFMPRYSPSPHMAVGDTCSGCHVKIPTASEQDAGYASNHNFTTDLTICANCHGKDGVNGAGIQSQYQTGTAQLADAIETAMANHIYNAAGRAASPDAGVLSIPGGFALCAEVKNVTPGPSASFGGGPFIGNSGASAAFVPGTPFVLPPAFVYIPPNTITAVTFSSPTNSATVTLNQPVPAFNIYDVRDGRMTSPSPAPAAALTSLNVNLYTVWVVTPVNGAVTAQNNPCLLGASNPDAGAQPGLGFPNGNLSGYWGSYPPGGGPLVSGMYLFPPTDVPAKAVWNYGILTREGSMGIHNFPWTFGTIGATLSALQSWKP